MSDYPRWQPPGTAPQGAPPPRPQYPQSNQNRQNDQPHLQQPPRQQFPQFVPPAPPPYGRGAPPPPPPKAPRRHRGLVAALVALALMAGAATIVVAGYRDSREVERRAITQGASTAPPPASFSASTNEIAFDFGDSSGIFTLNSYAWQDTTLIANVTVTITEGELGFTLGGWGVDGEFAYAEESTPPAPAFTESFLLAGESATGNVALTFETRGASTLRLDDSYHDEAITALPIP